MNKEYFISYGYVQNDKVPTRLTYTQTTINTTLIWISHKENIKNLIFFNDTYKRLNYQEKYGVFNVPTFPVKNISYGLNRMCNVHRQYTFRFYCNTKRHNKVLLSLENKIDGNITLLLHLVQLRTYRTIRSQHDPAIVSDDFKLI